ncbi:MAG: hypothetical protein AMXMBFR64_00810 [Myxococcales bacterium]
MPLPRCARRFLRAAVPAIKPRWDDFDPPVEGLLIDKIESDLSQFSRQHRLAVFALFFLFQWSGPLFLRGVRPFSMLSPEQRHRRLHTFTESRSPLLRNLAKALITLVIVNYYTLPEVQAYIGVDRQGWRADRIALQRRLLSAHPPGPDAPRSPAPLGSRGVVAPESYLTPGASAPRTSEER